MELERCQRGQNGPTRKFIIITTTTVFVIRHEWGWSRKKKAAYGSGLTSAEPSGCCPRNNRQSRSLYSQQFGIYITQKRSKRHAELEPWKINLRTTLRKPNHFFTIHAQGKNERNASVQNCYITEYNAKEYRNIITLLRHALRQSTLENQVIHSLLRKKWKCNLFFFLGLGNQATATSAPAQ